VKRGRKPESAAAKRARQDFTIEVLQKGPCWIQNVIPHVCSGPLDACHFIDKSWLKKHAAFTLRLDIAGQLACVWDPRNGAPGCRTGHGMLDSGFHPVSFELLPESVFDFCDDYRCWWRLESKFPGKAAA